MTREVLPNGNIRLTAPNGVKDIRNGQVYTEVICKPKSERYFVANEPTEREDE